MLGRPACATGGCRKVSGGTHLQGLRKAKGNRSVRQLHLVSRLPWRSRRPHGLGAPSLILICNQGTTSNDEVPSALCDTRDLHGNGRVPPRRCGDLHSSSRHYHFSDHNANGSTRRVRYLHRTVTNTTNTAVTWQVNGIVAETPTGYLHDGLYTAPRQHQSVRVTVTVVSSADSTKTASTAIAHASPACRRFADLRDRGRGSVPAIRGVDTRQPPLPGK